MIILPIVIIVGAIAISWGLGMLRRYLSRTLKQKLAGTERESITKGLDLFFTVILSIARISVWVAAILYIADLFPDSRAISQQIRDVLISSFNAPILTIGKSSYSIINLSILGALLFGLILLVRAFIDIFKDRVLSIAGLNRGAQEAIAVIVQYTLIFIGTLVLLQIWGLDLSSLTILASALSIGLGIGLQNIAKNFGSGLILVFERPIQVGDFIEVGDLNGTVERIGARSTEIRTLDRVSIIVPNSRFLDSEVINWSHGNPISRLHLPLGVAYGSDPQQVRTVLIESASGHPKVLASPAPSLLFKGFGDSSLDFELLVWTAEPDKQFLLKSDLYFLIYEVLNQNQIEIPFPQRDLHLRSGKVEISSQLESALIGLADKLSKPK
ncbi:mechanosensitive ion channel family protein [Phormidium tenue]|uniref:Mechanosensitive ion channel n=1 Tax=Phormidium tenue FACHB-1050 TaxID=2692857 RepID=A0ABR8CI97_9CYAN|nr:mechanosensitive ion channel domain-containing protein [Phormidium tenue]MBD2319755.1 mechanosensitive ion channel [Phormidium tenue FACHB-1050]